MAHGEQPLTTAVLIHQLPDAFAEKAIEILETNEVLSRSSVKTTKTSVMGTEIYLDSEVALERAVFYGAVTIFTTSYRIYPLVTDLTVHGAQAHMRREDLKRHMQRLGPVLFVYEEKGTNNYRVIIHHPEIPEKVLGWPKSCDVIFKDGLKYPITFFCRFCRTHGHLRCQCDRVKGKITEKKSKLCLKKSPKFRSPTEYCIPPISSSREHNEYSFRSNKTLLRNSKAMTLSRTISQVPIPSTNCDSNDPSDNKKLTKKFHKQKYYMVLKNEKPDFNKSSVKRKLDSPIEVNGAKRKTLQQIKDHKLKRVHSDSVLPDHTLESAKNLLFSLKKENEASDKDLNQMKDGKYPGKEETTHLVPIVDPILSGVSRKISDSAIGITQAGSRGLKGEEKNNTKHLSDLKLKHPKDRTSIPKSSSKASILPSSHPDFSNSLLKSNLEDFLTVEKLNDIINHVKKNRIVQEMALKSSKEENTDQLTERESTKVKIHRENARFNKSVNFKYVRKQPGKMAKQTCYPKFQGTNSVPNLPHDTQQNKEKDLYPVKNIEEPSMDNHVAQEKTVCDGSSSSKGFGISDTRETVKVRRKSTNPITSETMKKIIENSSGELSQSALKAFFVQVVNRKKPLELARNYSKNVDLIIRQLNCIVMDYFNGQERVPKAEGEIRWIKSLIKRIETEKKATSQANKSVIAVPISERLQIRVKKEICD